jgi:PAS domain S-box-containing protein
VNLRGRDASGTTVEISASEVTRARLAALVESSADAIVGETLEGIVTDWNPAAERLYGYRADEVIGKPLWRLIPPERLPEADEILARARAGDSIVEFETVRRAKDGRQVDVALTVSPVWSESGEIIATSAIIRDITERKANERALAESEALFRAAFANAPIGMALVAADERTLQVNRAICDMLGFSEEELLATTLRALTHPDDVVANHELVERALAGEIDSYQMEKRYVRKDGGIIWAHLSVSLVRNDNGAPIHFISQMQDITERKAAAAELAETHQRTRDVLERITDGFCAFDREWRFTYLNPAAERIIDRSREAVLRTVLWEAFPELVGTSVYDAYHRAMADGVTTTVPFFFPPRSAWFDIRAYPSVDGLSVFFRDVTATRHLEQELHASEAKYRALVEQLPVVVYLLADDEHQTPLYFSSQVMELLRSTPERMQSRTKHWLEDVHPDDRARVAMEDAAQSAAAGEVRFRSEYRMLRDDGTYVWVRDECVPVYDDAGAVVAWQGVLMDISDRIEADEARARLAAIVEGAEDAIISRALDGTITSWNQGAEHLYGYRADEMIGQSVARLFPEELDSDALSHPEEFYARPAYFDATRLRRDGTPIDVAVAISPIRNPNGNGVVTGVASITRDISARKRADEDLRAALEAAEAGIRAKNLFLAMMSHELRTPLQAVLGYADFLLSGHPTTLTAEQREDIGYIHAGAGRMVALIEQMLDLSRMEAGRLELESKPVVLSEILEQVRQDVTPQAAAKALIFTIELPESLPLALGDPVRLRQILLNLADNAVKFTDRGTVRIAARATGDDIEVTVSDTGIGIAAEALPHIFEEFRQVDGNLTRRYGGAGLGLAISRRLAEQMGGSITVSSQPGTGSTFTLHLIAAPPGDRTLANQDAGKIWS